MHKYRLISKKGEGTFSEVLKAQAIKTGRNVAIKCMKNTFDSIDQVNNLREIQALRRLGGHPNVIKLAEVLYDEPTGRLALVFELMDMNMYEAIRGRRHYLPEAKVQHCVYELLKAMDHMHRNGIFHRDVKPENVLLSPSPEGESGKQDQVKLADLGSCRGIYSRQPYTEYISTRWYRAPECLLTDGYYNFKMDIFAGGCVWFEIMALFPLFPGSNELDQIQKIHNVLGTPSPELLARKFKCNASHSDFNFLEKRGTGIERLIPHASAEVSNLMQRLLEYDPDDRIVARQALKDPYFRELRAAERQEGGQADATVSAAARAAPEVRTSNTGMEAKPSNIGMDGAGCGAGSSSSSVGSAAGHGLYSGGAGGSLAAAPEVSTLADPAPEDADSLAASTLPALGGSHSTTRLKEMPSMGSSALYDKQDEEEDVLGTEDSTSLLPPIGKAGQQQAKQRSSKEKEKAKAVKGNSKSFHANASASDTAGSSKGFERQPPGVASLASSSKKLPQSSSSLAQSSGELRQSSSLQQIPQSNASVAAREGREPKGQLPRQYVSPYSHTKQPKR